MHDVYAYDVTNPGAPRLARHTVAQAIDNMLTDDDTGGHDVEQVVLISIDGDPLGGPVPMRIVGNEIAGTIAVFSISAA